MQPLFLLFGGIYFSCGKEKGKLNFLGKEDLNSYLMEEGFHLMNKCITKFIKDLGPFYLHGIHRN